MKEPDIPFNSYVGLRKGEAGDGFLLRLPFEKKYENHLGTFHASALFTLAEASGGEFLLNEFRDQDLEAIPVVRRATVRYSRPATSDAGSRASWVGTTKADVVKELQEKRRSLFTVRVEIFTPDQQKIMTADFEWFVALK
ncbi:MAG: PaaI family thioesterase [Bacteroidota bacterium]